MPFCYIVINIALSESILYNNIAWSNAIETYGFYKLPHLYGCLFLPLNFVRFCLHCVIYCVWFYLFMLEVCMYLLCSSIHSWSGCISAIGTGLSICWALFQLLQMPALCAFSCVCLIVCVVFIYVLNFFLVFTLTFLHFYPFGPQ